jgi:nicotinamide mononucleotide adenylyltransferase
MLRPRPGTSQVTTDAKTSLFSFILDECKFKTETKWGLEQMAHLGTSVWKWGVDYKEVCTYKRKAAKVDFEVGAEKAPEKLSYMTNALPEITEEKHCIPLPFFEHRPIDKVLVDPKLAVGDIRFADWVVDVQYMDFYQLKELFDSITKADATEGWSMLSDAEMKGIWTQHIGVASSGTSLQTEQVTYVEGVVHHAENINQNTSPDPLRTKLEVLEYWDKKRKILVLNQSKVLYTGENPFGVVPFLSANWWNRPKGFYGMGLGLIVGQNQRVDQGTINAILKMLSFGVNPVYLRSRDSNSPTQTIRSSLGKILTVDGEVEKSYRLLETPKVPSEVWAALQESEKATESTSGADQMLVQGSTAGPRTSMGRTAGGANILAGASATRLDGPLDNFIEQVFKPFMYVIDMIIFRYMPDAAIFAVLGKERGQEFAKQLDFEEFNSAVYEYEVLAGASLAAKRTMAQSMVMLTQILDNPQIQESLAEINEEYIDFKPILSMWMEASEWKNTQDIIKKMTPEMKQKRAANSKAALMQQQMQAKQQSEQQKFQQKQELEDQASDNRIKRDIVREAARANSMSESVEGVPAPQGIQGEMPTVQ